MMTALVDKLREALMSRRTNYVRTFNGPVAAPVLKDLARFCRAHESTVHPNRDAMLVLQGRREVWLRIQNHLNLSPDQLWELYSGRPAQHPGDTNG